MRGPRDGHRRAGRLRATPNASGALTIWLYTYSHDGGHTALSGRVAGGPRAGVILSLLSLSASPERVWLHAAELDERCSRRTFRYLPVAIEAACTFQSFPPLTPESGEPPTPRSPFLCSSES